MLCNAYPHIYSFSTMRLFGWLNRLLTRTINQHVLIVLVSLYLVLTANITFFHKVLEDYQMSQNAGFILSLACFLFAFIWLAIQLISYRLTIKFVLILLLMVSAICGYFTDAYGTIFDKNMLINTLQTDKAEAGDLLAFWLMIRVFLLGVIPSFFIAKVKITRFSWKKSVLYKSVTLLLAVGLILLCLLPFGDQYASFFRQHKPLRYYTNPIIPIYSVIKLGNDYVTDMRRPDSLILHATDARNATTDVKSTIARALKPKLMLFIVGESVRADHIGLNGYERETTPLLYKQTDVYSFKKVTACGTSTAYSVPCMFSYADQNHYDVDLAKYNENVLDTLNKQGVKVVWRDNNSNSKGVADRLSYEDFKTIDHNVICDVECRDVGMLVGLDKLLTTTETAQNTLIVLHQMGSHGPAYYKRYPHEFEVFAPVCASSELSKCDSQTIINGYDNTIVYMDYFLNEVIEMLKKYEHDYDVMMLYVSDHGESLGENNIYLHGLPYSIAPSAQKHIPVIVWSPTTNGVDASKIMNLLDTPVSHDYITPTLLHFFGITTQEVEGKPVFF